MSDGFSGDAKKLSGRVIIDELIRNADLGRFDLAYSILLPGVFTVYLHPGDHARLAGVFIVQVSVTDGASSAQGTFLLTLN